MTLNEFISHQKHKSVDIIIIQDCYGAVYIGDVGSYNHWIYKSKLDNIQIENITFSSNDTMIINLDPDAEIITDGKGGTTADGGYFQIL